MKVFFYGLFMDEALLASKGITPGESVPGFVDDFGLRIGERATLESSPKSRSWGVVMEIATSDLSQLYAEKSVADYVPEPVVVEVEDGTSVEATCYNLPGDKVTGTNREYAEALLKLAGRLGFPDSYLEQIRQAGS